MDSLDFIEDVNEAQRYITILKLVDDVVEGPVPGGVDPLDLLTDSYHQVLQRAIEHCISIDLTEGEVFEGLPDGVVPTYTLQDDYVLDAFRPEGVVHIDSGRVRFSRIRLVYRRVGTPQLTQPPVYPTSRVAAGSLTWNVPLLPNPVDLPACGNLVLFEWNQINYSEGSLYGPYIAPCVLWLLEHRSETVVDDILGYYYTGIVGSSSVNARIRALFQNAIIQHLSLGVDAHAYALGGGPLFFPSTYVDALGLYSSLSVSSYPGNIPSERMHYQTGVHWSPVWTDDGFYHDWSLGGSASLGLLGSACKGFPPDFWVIPESVTGGGGTSGGGGVSVQLFLGSLFSRGSFLVPSGGASSVFFIDADDVTIGGEQIVYPHG